MHNDAIEELRDSNRMLDHSMRETAELFRQSLAMMNELQEAKERLEEAEKLLKEWKGLIHDRVTCNSGVDAYHVIQLEEKTEKFLEKEGKGE